MNLIHFSTPAVTLPAFSPLARLNAFQHEVDRLFDLPPAGRCANGLGEWSPVLDLYQDKDSFLVVVELPGLRKEDIKLSLHGDSLTLSGEHRHDTVQDAKSSLRNERFLGSFERNITLPMQVDGTRVTAAYEAGILTITLPKAEAAKPRQIEIGVN